VTNVAWRPIPPPITFHPAHQGMIPADTPPSARINQDETSTYLGNIDDLASHHPARLPSVPLPAGGLRGRLLRLATRGVCSFTGTVVPDLYSRRGFPGLSWGRNSVGVKTV